MMTKLFAALAAIVLLGGLVLVTGCGGGGTDDPVGPIDETDNGTDYNGSGIEVTSDDNGLVTINTTHLDNDTVYTYQIGLSDETGTPLSEMKVYYLESGDNSVIVAYDPNSAHAPAVACGSPEELRQTFDTAQTVSKLPALVAAGQQTINLALQLASNDGAANTFVFPAYDVSSFFVSENTIAGEDYTRMCRTFDGIAEDLVARINGNALFRTLVVSIGPGAIGFYESKSWAMFRNDILGEDSLLLALKTQLIQQAAQHWSLTSEDLGLRRVSVKSFFDGSNIPSAIRNQFAILEISSDTSICSGIGAISGTVTDAATGDPISGAQITLAGPAAGGASSNANGEYSFSGLPDGDYTITVSKSGYIQVTKQVAIDGGAAEVNLVISEVLSDAQYRFVLSWGSLPTDLDAHAWNGDYHVFYMNKGSDSTAPYMELDIDDISSYGPETITISQLSDTIKYAVHNYSGSPSITTSSAIVHVYQGSSLIQTYTVPTTGGGMYWYVCDLTASGLIDRDYLTDTPPGPAQYTPKQ
ncbi:hypothetical protein GF356_07390 [candidate division GN15 bacterium]|nr:hypothetical protein [candidate division GN15 bacterium]